MCKRRWPIPRLVRVAIVGDRQCGKTELRRMFADRFSSRLDADAWPILTVPIDGDSVEIAFGQEGHPHDIMPFVKSHVVLLCFAVDSVESLDSVRTKWSPYVDEYCRWRRVILVCCKRDIRDAMTEENYSPGMVKAEQGMELAGQIGAYRYVECSAYTGEGVKELLEHAARLSRIPVTPISP
ncbi:Rho GTPase rho1, partial [Zopfochytrium polystomum]